MDSPRRIESCFETEEDKDRIRRLINVENGLYMSCSGRLQESIEACNVDGIVDCLNQLMDINKTILAMSTARLQELALQTSGELV